MVEQRRTYCPELDGEPKPASPISREEVKEQQADLDHASGEGRKAISAADVIYKGLRV